MSEESPKKITIDLTSCVGRYCIKEVDGIKINKKIFNAIKSGQSVVLNFNNIIVCSGEFLNASVGRLLGDFDINTINKTVKFIIPRDKKILKETIQLVLSNSDTYYNNEKHRKKLTAAYKKHQEKLKKDTVKANAKKKTAKSKT